MVGWSVGPVDKRRAVRKVKDKDELRPAEAERGLILANNTHLFYY